MNIYMATWLGDRTLGKGLTKLKSKKRLVSFHFLKEQNISKKLLKIYCTKGNCDPRKIKK